MTIDLLLELCRKTDWTIADEIALNALPDEVKHLVVHALKCRGRGDAVLEDGNGHAVSLAEAYDEGWDAAMEEARDTLRGSCWTNPYRKRESKVKR